MDNNKNTSSNADNSDVQSKIDADNPEVHQTQSFDMANDENAKEPGTMTNRLDKEIDSKVSKNRPSNVGITSNEELNGRR